jgi:hypothetical protein
MYDFLLNCFSRVRVCDKKSAFGRCSSYGFVFLDEILFESFGVRKSNRIFAAKLLKNKCNAYGS